MALGNRCFTIPLRSAKDLYLPLRQRERSHRMSAKACFEECIAYAGRRSLLLHHPSEACQDFILSSRAEEGASVPHAASQPGRELSSATEHGAAAPAATPFWEVRLIPVSAS